MVQLGWVLWDKYLGDALYAAMIYTIVRLIWSAPQPRLAALSMAIMTAIEVFQLTLIPARLVTSEHLLVRLGARLLGTEFSLLDLCAYVVGIGATYFVTGTEKAGER